MVGFAATGALQTVAQQYLVQALVVRRMAEAEEEAEPDPMRRRYYQAENWAEIS